jgi:hypothetical protein
MLNVLELAGTFHIADVRVVIVLVARLIVVLDVAAVSRLPVAWVAAVQNAPLLSSAGNERVHEANERGHAARRHNRSHAVTISHNRSHKIGQQSKHGCPGPRTIAYELIAHLQHARA